MPRPMRIQFENAWYHVMNRGAARRQIFQRDEQRAYFLDLLRQCRESFGLEIHAYCLMGNHFHLLVRTPNTSLSDAMMYLGSSYVRKFNRENRIDGPMFRARFKAILIDADSYLVQVSRYIHRNPVEAGLVERPGQYVWSSFRLYQNPCEAPSWLVTQEILRRSGAGSCFGDYCRFVENSSYPSMREFYNSRSTPGILGGKEFRHYVSGFGFPDALAKKNNKGSSSLEIIKDETARFFNTCAEEITHPSQGRTNSARLVAMHLADKLSALRNADVAQHFGVKQAAIAVMLSRFRKRIAKNLELAAQVALVERSIREKQVVAKDKTC